MLRCCAGICGGSAGSAAGPAPAPEGRQVVKPTVRLDEAEAPSNASFEDLASHLDLLLAPPGAVKPCAVVTDDFPRNVARLLVLVPSEGAAEGAWDTGATGGRGDVVPIFRWAQANSYAACLFSPQALFNAPAEVWERVLKGSPASSVSVLAARGSLPVVAAALAPLHPLLLGRFRLALTPFGGDSCWPPSWPADLPQELAQHLRSITVQAPAAWASEQVRPAAALQALFEMLALREDRFQKHEAKKYQGFQGLKENDMPGLRRMNAEQRIKRLDRDRGNDELANLLRKNENAREDDEEPGVD